MVFISGQKSEQHGDKPNGRFSMLRAKKLLHAYHSFSTPKKIGFSLAAFAALIVAPVASLALASDTGSHASFSSSDSAANISSPVTTQTNESQPQPVTAPAPKDSTSAPDTKSSASSSSSTQVTVNGQNIPVPQDGSIHESVPTNSGKVSVDVSVQNGESNESGSSSSHSSTNIRIKSHSTTNASGDSP